jgi:predicted TIM-barrel fold metal-dependent hydrolase
LKPIALFDSHLHIIDKRFPLTANNGYLPNAFACADYLASLSNYELRGGAIVSGSFQGFDQQYLIAALKTLGDRYVGVTQLPASATDVEILALANHGVKAVRFNLKRGGSEDVAQLSNMAARVFELANWHVELYADAAELGELYPFLIKLPAVSIDHLGLTKAGFNTLCKLVENGVKVKATGFGRVNFDVGEALKTLYSINPKALLFGSDLPSTRAPRPFDPQDIVLIQDCLGSAAAKLVLCDNAQEFYGLPKST